MRIIIMCALILGSFYHLAAQNQKLLLINKKKIDASLPFYTINSMSCYVGGEYIIPEREKYERQDNREGPLFTLSTRDKFSLLDGAISGETKENQGLMENFEIYVYQKNLPRHWNATTFKVFLKEKNWKAKKETLIKKIEEKLQKQFPLYKLSVEMSDSRKEDKTTLNIKIFSSTGGNEFETREVQRQRFSKMKTEVEPFLKGLIRQYHTQRLRQLQRVVIEPYRKNIRSKRNPKKLHTLQFDIQSLGKYNPDKQYFYDAQCSSNWSLKYIGVPLEQAKSVRAAPTEYQLRAYVFEGHMSSPWCPNRDATAFDFYEVVHKPTNTIVARSFARFKHPSRQYYYNFMLTFPRI